MPYEGERAGYNPVRRLAESKRVHELLAKHKLVQSSLRSSNLSEASVCTLLTPATFRRGEWTPDYVIAIDGSYAPVAVDNGFPSSEAAYVTVATVLLDLKKMQELDAVRPVDPKLFRNTRTTDPVDTVLPGCNVTYEGESSPKASLRRGVTELFADQRAFGTGESLLETYQVLLKHKPSSQQDCPYGEDCGTNPPTTYQPSNDTYPCSCPLKQPLYSTDALRFHERFNPVGSNGMVFGEIMQVLERVWLVHVLRGMESRGHLNALSRLAIILDGPLAIFGQPAWLSRAISAELKRLNENLYTTTGSDLLIVGIEKTGLFVDHFEQFCAASDKRQTALLVSPQTALLLTDDYIKKQIIFSEGKHQYGDATYFGRKLLYRTKSGARIVASLPFLTDDHRDLKRALPEQYPRLADALNLFDALVSSRYPNALVPVSLAHSEAAIPLSHGGRVLERLARELIKHGD